MRTVNTQMFYGNISLSNSGVTGTGGTGVGDGVEILTDRIISSEDRNTIYVNEAGDLVLSVPVDKRVSVTVNGVETSFIDINGFNDGTYASNGGGASPTSFIYGSSNYGNAYYASSSPAPV